jgi:nitrite reductase/ring-hydroxylating ferredoxin subunit
MSHKAPERIDALLDTTSREGLTGRTLGNVHARTGADPDELSRPPDGRPAHEQPQWRKDFPIDWPKDEYVSRRDFSKFLTLTSLAFAVGQLWIVGRSWWRQSRGLPPLIRIASRAELPVGKSLVFNYPGAHDSCLLVRLSEDDFVAYSQKCTHLSCAVVPKVERGVLHCPCHEGYFDLRSGRRLAGPPPRPLPRVTLEVRGDDLYATGMEEGSV